MRLSEKEVYKVIRRTRSGPTAIRLEESMESSAMTTKVAKCMSGKTPFLLIAPYVSWCQPTMRRV